MYNNLYHNDSFVFSTTAEGVRIYNMDLDYLGGLVIDQVSCVYADESNVYLATTNSGVLYSPLTSISGGVFDDIFVYKQFPEILSNCTRYIHGAGNYLLITTESGIEQLNIVTSNRIYNVSSKDISKCFQTEAGRFYYISAEIVDSFFNMGYYKSIITLTEKNSIPNIQIKILLYPYNFDYDKAAVDGSDLRFYDSEQVELPYYIEIWNSSGFSMVWVKLINTGITEIYMVYGGTFLTAGSNPIAVFDMYDNFDYPVATFGTNVFNPTYGTITTSGTIHPEYLYDGDVLLYYTYSFPTIGDYIQIAFFTPIIITQVKMWQISSTVEVDVYIYASNTGTFSGEEVLLFTKTTPLSWADTFVFYHNNAYTYYRVVRGAGLSYWQLTEINMFEMTYTDITTVSGSPWLYTTDSSKFIIMEEGVLTCNSSNNDYIETDSLLGLPIIIEQRLKLNYGNSGEVAYSTTLEPNSDGVLGYPAGTPTLVPIINGVYGSHVYNPVQALTTSWTVLSIVIALGTLKVSVGTTLSYWPVAPNGAKNRTLRIWGGVFESSVSIDWIRVRKYSIYAPEVKEIFPAILMRKKYGINTVYDNNANWSDSSVGCFYDIFEGEIINDFFVTEGTSNYSSNDNVLFIATSDGLIVLEERQGDEDNSRIKYFKAKGNV